MSEAGTAQAPIANGLSIDVEDYFQVSAFERYVVRSDWDRMECRVERNIERILSMLADADAHATFFTLGWVAERYPRLVRSIADAGHEIASHGYSHARATDQERDQFLADIRLAKAIIEDVTGSEAAGYRAPSFSVGDRNPWVFAAIAEAGHRYSSSLYPIHHDHYGVPTAPRFAHTVVPGLLEVPIATVRVFRWNWPAGGGGYFRLFPYALSRRLIERINGHDRQPAMFYFHPWELDPGQPRVAGLGVTTRFRHYVNLHRTEARIRRLIADFRWDRADRVFLKAAA